MWKSVLAAGLGGFIGTVLRFLIARYIQTQSMSLFPWSTLLINTLGCLLIGIFYGLSERGSMMHPGLRIFLTVGLCGGFTTFSTFSNDAMMLMQDREWLRVTFYATASFFLGLVAVYLGRLITKII